MVETNLAQSLRLELSMGDFLRSVKIAKRWVILSRDALVVMVRPKRLGATRWRLGLKLLMKKKKGKYLILGAHESQKKRFTRLEIKKGGRIGA